jgi:tetratricopeptide (TPR) repeat protein
VKQEEAAPTTERLQLESERDFLLQSLDDLELEHESGGIDDESYAQLRDDYTARAAAVLRTLRDGVDMRPEPARATSTRRRVVVIAAVAAFAVGAGIALAAALGARLPGQTPTGNSQASSSSSSSASNKQLAKQEAALQRQVTANPNDYDLRLALALVLEEENQYVDALKQYDAAIGIDGNRPEAHANSGRLLFLTSAAADSQHKQELMDEALAAFNKAIEVGPSYADTFYFRGVLYAQEGQLANAQTDFQQYLVATPNGRWADAARTLLARVTTALESPSTTVPPTTRSPTTTRK